MNKNSSKLLTKNYYVLETWMAPVAFLIVFIFNCFFTPSFASWFTIRNIFTQSTSTVLIAIGMTMVISAGAIDISVGSGYCWNAMLFAVVLEATDSLFLAFTVAIVSAILIGLINGLNVSKFKIQPMIATMTIMYILRSLAKVLTGGRIVRIRNDFLEDFVFFKFFDVVPIHFAIILIPILIGLFLVKKTPFGIYIEACGDNALAARAAGIKVVKNLSLAYIICNVLAAFGGIFDSAAVSSADPMALGLGYEMDAIAATVIGGTPISGGRANIIGTVFGVFILRVIIIMINMNNIPEQWSYVVSAFVIIVAVVVQNLRKNGNGGKK